MENNNTYLRIVITGGHLTPAVATISELKRQSLHTKIFFIGRKHVSDTNQALSHEKETVEALGVTFLTLITGRFLRGGSVVGVILSLFKVPVGITMALWYLCRVRPHVVVSFGGYVALPVAIASFILDIPIITHEQTVRIGLGTKIIAALSNVVCVSEKSQVKLFRYVRCLYTGLPLRELIVRAARAPKPKARSSRPLVFITGGTSGSLSINTVVYDALKELLRYADVVHQVGRASYYKAKQVFDSLREEEQSHYTIVEYMDEARYVEVLCKADLIVGRSGANTVAEIAALGKTAIFIPLPWASYDEQYNNARVLERQGSASILQQQNLTRKRLVSLIKKHIVYKAKYEKHAKDYQSSVTLNAAELLSREIVSLGVKA